MPDNHYNQHIKGVIYENQKVSAEDHAALFQMLISDGVISGCGVSSLLNKLTISSGVFILAGRLARIEASEEIEIPDTIADTTVRLTGVCDLTQIATKTEFQQFYFRLDPISNGEYPALRKENINSGNGQYYEVEWAILAIDAQGAITNCDVRIGESSGGGGSGGSNFISEEDITFNGAPISGSSTVLYSSNGSDWEVIILEAAADTIAFAKRPGAVDICMVSAGNTGSQGSNGQSQYISNPKGGDGGNGGEVLNSMNFTLDRGEYDVTVGTASNPDTSIANVNSTDPLLKAYQANGEANGGSGDGRQNGGDGKLAFGDDGVINTTYKTRKYGAGGGKGGYYRSTVVYANGVGGTTGGGDGGLATNSAQGGTAGADHTGSGGGGGSCWYEPNYATYYGASGGAGGSGIIMIRNHRSSAA